MNILFRADGNAKIGAGHIMRCFALAQGLMEQNGTPVFLCSDIASGFKNRLGSEIMIHNLKAIPYTEEDALETIEVAKSLHIDWIVLDGYSFDEHYEKTLKKSGIRFLRLDDHSHLNAYRSDIILNQNPHASDAQYQNIEEDTKLLMGTKYTMLQRAFRTTTPKQTVSNNAKRMLITLGGSDPANVTPRVIRSMQGLDIELVVAVGGGNLHGTDIKQAIEESDVSVTLIENASNMHELMNDVDLAITAAGSTCYELAYIGVPMIAIIVADNQVGVAQGLAKHGACINLGWEKDIDEGMIRSITEDLLNDSSKRRGLQESGKTVIDGLGVFRVLQSMQESRLYLRHVQESDIQLIFDWANDADTRKASFSSDPILWEDHEKWFASKLADPHHLFFIGMNEDEEPVGQVRFDIDDDAAMISVSIAPNMRGKKYAVPLVTEGCNRCFGSMSIKRIDAYIKPENNASTSVFEKAGFQEVDPKEFNGHPALHYVLSRS